MEKTYFLKILRNNDNKIFFYNSIIVNNFVANKEISFRDLFDDTLVVYDLSEQYKILELFEKKVINSGS